MNQPEIVYEDNHIMVVVKPPNMLVQGDNTGDPDLTAFAKQYIREKYNKPGEVYLGLVHRMDRPVGGLLCLARTSKAAARLTAQVKDNVMKREYIAVCEGETPDRFKLVNYLVKDEEKNLVRVGNVYDPGAKNAVLYGRTLARLDGQSLVTIILETGRAHQIRVQMAHDRHPIVGDMRYGHGQKGLQIALWGARLTLRHPTLDDVRVFMAMPPADGAWKRFERVIDGLYAVWPQVREII